MATTRTEFDAMDDGTNTATIYLDDDAIMVIAQGDDETEAMLHRYASLSEWAVKQTALVKDAAQKEPSA